MLDKKLKGPCARAADMIKLSSPALKICAKQKSPSSSRRRSSMEDKQGTEAPKRRVSLGSVRNLAPQGERPEAADRSVEAPEEDADRAKTQDNGGERDGKPGGDKKQKKDAQDNGGELSFGADVVETIGRVLRTDEGYMKEKLVPFDVGLHNAARMVADRLGTTINPFINQALRNELKRYGIQ